MRRLFLIRITLLFCLAPLLAAQEIRRFGDKYRHKFVVVLKDGLAVGLCNEPEPAWKDTIQPILMNTIRNGVVDLTQDDTFLHPLTPSPGCRTVVPELIRKGEILRVTGAGISNIYGRRFRMIVTNVSPHAVQRGVGAFEHQSLERGQGEIIFILSEKDPAKEMSEADAAANPWFKIFDTQEDAAVFGNTASGAFVREVKAGMTPLQVETVLGAPQTKVDLGKKVLYRYRDMTVEFNNGLVVDVR